MKKVVHSFAGNPLIFNALRRIIEFNYGSVKRAIRNELRLSGRAEQAAPGASILDLPCGTGEFSTLFPAGGYHGMDIAENYIAYARRKYPGYRYFLRDARDTGFDDGYFDAVLTLGFLHHLDDATVAPVLKEVKRILKPDGTFLLIEDTPIASAWNVIGKELMKYDVGSYIRPAAEYRAVLERDFAIHRNYNINSGVWRYSVFVMSPLKHG